MALLEVRGLTTGFGANQVLNGLDLEVEAGTVAVLLGLNGAGKSVAMKTISGLQPTWTGSIRLEGTEVAHLEAEDRIRAGLGHVLQSKAVFGQLTVAENLRLGAASVKSRAAAQATRARLLGIYPRLAERAGQLAGSLSGGEQAMLAVARSLMAEPKLLLVDEPSAGLSPLMVEALGETLRQVRDAGTTLLMVEQNVGFGLELADEVFVLEKGRVVYRDRADGLDMDKVSNLLGIGDLLGAPVPPAAPARSNRPAKAQAAGKPARRANAPATPRGGSTAKAAKATSPPKKAATPPKKAAAKKVAAAKSPARRSSTAAPPRTSR